MSESFLDTLRGNDAPAEEKKARKINSAYAWTAIHMGGETKNFKPGDKVNRDDLAEGDFDQFLNEGVLRTVEFPEGVGVYEAVRHRMNSEALAAFNAATSVGTPEQAEQPVNQTDETTTTT